MNTPSSRSEPGDKQTLEPLQVSEILNDSNFNLLDAASQGNLASVKALLEQGADIESEDQCGRTPLCLAVKSENLDVVNVLLDAGARVNACDCLHLAVKSENLDVVNVLLDAGARVNACDCLHRTPLHEARSQEVVKALLARGADIEARNYAEETPLMSVVCTRGRVKAVKALKAVKTLLAAGASINARNRDGQTPLHRAHSQVAKELLAWGADIEARDNTGGTPLFSAYHQCRLEELKVLLAAGACVNARDDLGRTPLHYAWSSEIVNELLAWGADIEARDNDKATPLICAITHHDRLESAKALLFAGANTEAADKFQRTPLHLAASSKCYDLRYMEVLLSEGANLEAREESTGYTPLHEAVFSGSGKKVQVLVAEGANYKALDWNRSTPLHVAMGRIDKLDDLLAAAGRFDSIDSDNEPVSFQPQSLQACARTAIRSRLVKHRKNTGQPLSESVLDLPLDPTLKAYLYKPLMGTYL
ncbi:ankyrin repeat domain-containing protein [Thalassotalea sp. G20_0]|uniref:ankyrin repeat domain-containing protein n=1 Tax=Thalassotalea sp. G20_0 TaxID=2821093 RepID=UPI001AD9A565|nr:ankyrin repeat domain-containing protein [Thalassotalea sp. G20_0]MBO9492599.1 ankyrin repeat domain-containing protein [Thalassotalea sp. G20_0]